MPNPTQSDILTSIKAGTYQDSTPVSDAPKEQNTRTMSDILNEFKQGSYQPATTEEALAFNSWETTTSISDYINDSTQYNESGSNLTFKNPETIHQGILSDWSNSLMRAIDEIDKSKWEGRANDAQHQIDLISKQLDNPSLDDNTRIELTSKLNTYLEELNSATSWADKQQQNIDENPITKDYNYISEHLQMDESTNPWDYIAYELPKDLGGSASEIATMVATAFGPQVLTAAAEAAIGGSALGPVGSAVLGVVSLIGGGIAMYNMRDNETDAEAYDAYSQKFQMLYDEFIKKNGREPDYNELRDLRLEAYKGIDAVKSRNMMLSVGDYAQLGLLLIPGSGIIKNAFSGSKLSTKIALNAGSLIGGAMMEGAEELDQFQIKKDYIDGKLSDKGFFGTLSDSFDYRVTSLGVIMGVDVPGLSDDPEAMNAMRAGLILGGGMNLASSVKNTVSDIKDFKSSKKFVQNNRSMLFDQEITENKAKAYLDFFKNNKAGFLFSQLKNVDLSANPELNTPANKEAALRDAKLARGLYETIKANEGSNKGLVSTFIDKFKAPNTNVDALFIEAYKVSTELKKSNKLKSNYIKEAQELINDENASLDKKNYTPEVIAANAKVIQLVKHIDILNKVLKTFDETITEEKKQNIEKQLAITTDTLTKVQEELNSLLPDTKIPRSTASNIVQMSTNDVAIVELYDKSFLHEASIIDLETQFKNLVSKGSNETKKEVLDKYANKPKEAQNNVEDNKAKENNTVAEDELDSTNEDELSELNNQDIDLDEEEEPSIVSTEPQAVEEDNENTQESDEDYNEDNIESLSSLFGQPQTEQTEQPATEEKLVEEEEVVVTPVIANDKATNVQKAINKVLRLGALAKDSIKNTLGKYYEIEGRKYQRQSEYNNNSVNRDISKENNISEFKKKITNMDNGAVVGDYIDTVARLLFDNSNLTFSEFNSKASDDLSYQYREIHTEATFNELKSNILKVKESLKAKHGGDDVRFITDPSFVYRTEDIPNFSGVGGVMDMLIIDSNNNIHIYDFKNKKGKSKSDVNNNLNQYGNTLEKWIKQQFTYSQLFKVTTGLDITSTNAIVFPTIYTAEEFKGNTQEDVDNFKPTPKAPASGLVAGECIIKELSGEADLRAKAELNLDNGVPINVTPFEPVVELNNKDLAKTREDIQSNSLDNIEIAEDVTNIEEFSKGEYEKDSTKSDAYTTTWKSVNNTEATELEKEDQRLIELTAFLENPNNPLTQYTVEYVIDVDYLKTRKLGETSLGEAVAKKDRSIKVNAADVVRLPVKCIFRDKDGRVMNNSMGQPHAIFLEDPKAKRFSKDSTKQAVSDLLELKLKILKAYLAGKVITTTVANKSRGYISFEKDETTGEFIKENVASVLGVKSSDIKLVIGNKGKAYVGSSKTLDSELMAIGNTATPGAIYAVIKDSAGNNFPLRLHSSKLTVDEARLVVEIYTVLANNPKAFNLPVSLSNNVMELFKVSKDTRVTDMPINLNTITHVQLLNTLLYEGRRVSTNLKNKVYMDSHGNLNVGASAYSKEELITKKDEIINTLHTNTNRQVNLKELNNPKYVKYIIDNNIVTTNAKPTQSKSLFVQPAITLSRDSKIEEFVETPAIKEQSEEVFDAKADIERRRQEVRGEALERIGIDRVGFDGKQRDDWEDAKNQDLKIATNHAIERLSKNPNIKIASLPYAYSNAIKAELEIHGVKATDKTSISEIIEKLKEINAKYDAELAALEGTQQSTKDVRSKVEELKAKLARARSIKSKTKIQAELDALEITEAVEEVVQPVKKSSRDLADTEEIKEENSVYGQSSAFEETVDASYADDIFGMVTEIPQEITEEISKLEEFYGTLSDDKKVKLNYKTFSDFKEAYDQSILPLDEFIEDIKICR